MAQGRSVFEMIDAVLQAGEEIVRHNNGGHVPKDRRALVDNVVVASTIHTLGEVSICLPEKGGLSCPVEVV
tara:strand:+ start:1437 stop:1649 length:213 start_codon:yes stop_codon:yes gene_type:complete